MPDDIKSLEAKLGIVKEAPEIKVPVLVPEGGIKLPDVMDTPCCSMPLMGQELIDFNSGGRCPYCNAPNPDGNPTIAPQVGPAYPGRPPKGPNAYPDALIGMANPFSTQSDKSILVRMCTGPLAKVTKIGPLSVTNGPPTMNELQLPLNQILGREFFNEQIAKMANGDEQVKDWYKKSIGRLSREHFMILEDFTVKDMGSTNSTFLDRDEVIDEGGKFTSGKFLILADELALSRVHYPDDDGPALRVTHLDTGIAVDVPEGQQFHLGRLREDGRREPFAFVVSDTLKRTDGMDHDELRRISRRHAIIYIEEFEDQDATRGKTPSMKKGFTIENIDGKNVLIEESNVNNDYSMTAHQRKYELNAENSKISIQHKGAHELTIGKQNFLIEFID